MKINVFGTRGFPLIQGGVEKHCESLYPLLSSEYKMVVFRRKCYVHSEKTYHNIRFIDLPSTKIKGIETLLHSLLSTLYSFFQRPDIVHIHNIGPALFSPLLKLRGIKIVLTYHSANYEHEKWGFFARNLLRLSEKIALTTSDAIIFVNSMQRQKYNQKILQKSCYIPNGVNIPFLTDKTDYLATWNLQKNKYILTVGRITQEKGFDYLLSAFDKIANKDFKLVIAGGVETESRYFQQLKKNSAAEKVVFVNYVYGEALAQLYANAAFFVNASYNEGFPMVLLEAMSYNLAILASDIPGNSALNLPENSYFTTGDENELSDKLQQLIDKEPLKIKYDIENYSWDKIAKQTIDIYKNIQPNQAAT
ncbi:MAG: glycosyltransferase family 4 protein [Dysgonamonadaceae bacterium]|jgi:glycosyltransferase involved in cell wall biosynthesis|nr:glycosyltransferase family 4 protein [Dysgonamonadaceae bacterium]